VWLKQLQHGPQLALLLFVEKQEKGLAVALHILKTTEDVLDLGNWSVGMW